MSKEELIKKTMEIADAVVDEMIARGIDIKQMSMYHPSDYLPKPDAE